MPFRSETVPSFAFYGFGRPNLFDSIFGILFPICFIGVLCFFLFFIIRGIRQWNKNNHSPRLTVDVLITAKRTNVSHSSANSHHSSSTSYYVTFQVESGDRMEFAVSGADYGKVAEGDRGKLSFQGTRYLGFERLY